MSQHTVVETIEMECAEEGRVARLLVQWRELDGERVLHSVQCDNPKFAQLEEWDCHWSCWKRVEDRARRVGP